jgi:hypothetical protein
LIDKLIFCKIDLEREKLLLGLPTNTKAQPKGKGAHEIIREKLKKKCITKRRASYIISFLSLQ